MILLPIMQGGVFYHANELDEYKSTIFKLIMGRDFSFAIISVSITTVIVLLHSIFLGKWLVFVSTWMWVVYLDDRMVFKHILYVPDDIQAKTLLTIQPFILLLVSLMTFDQVTKSRCGTKSQCL